MKPINIINKLSEEHTIDEVVKEIPKGISDALVKDHSIGDTVYFYHGASDFSDASKIIGYIIVERQKTAYYALKWPDGYIGIGADDCCFGENKMNRYLDEF